jgi:hypothetical protein
MLWTQLHHSGAKPMPGAITTIDSSDHPLRIFAAIELSRTKWIVAIQVSGSDKASLIEVPSGDTACLLGILEKARQKIAGQELRPVEIHTCYEAGYDGFWLHRFLEARGIRNWIIDSASIQVSRRKRNVKTDRIDAGGLLRVLMARHRGEPRVCSVVVVPTPEEEDLKRLHRSRASLLRDRVRHVNRIKGLLNLQGISDVGLMRKDWLAGVSKMTTGDGRPAGKDRWHWTDLRGGFCHGSVLPTLQEQARGRKLLRAHANALCEWRVAPGSGDQQSRQPRCTLSCH